MNKALNVVKSLSGMYSVEEFKAEVGAHLRTLEKFHNLFEEIKNLKEYVNVLHNILTTNLNRKDLNELIKTLSEFSKFLSTVSKLANIMENIENFENLVENMRKLAYLLENLEVLTTSLAKIEKLLKDFVDVQDLNTLAENIEKFNKVADLLDKLQTTDPNKLIANITIQKLIPLLERIDKLELLMDEIMHKLARNGKSAEKPET